jgi:hypothetical protein
LKPIFDILGKRKCILVAPMPRYVVAGCCSNRSHVSNRLEPYFVEDMKMQLDGYRRHLKEFLFTAGRKNIKIYNPSHDLKNFTKEQTWGEDPIHPTREVISKMADTIISMVDNAETSEGGGGEATEGQGPNFRQDSHHRGQRNRWPGPRRGGDFTPTTTTQNGGRHNSPSYPRGGRDGRGGHFRGRARPRGGPIFGFFGFSTGGNRRLM